MWSLIGRVETNLDHFSFLFPPVLRPAMASRSRRLESWRPSDPSPLPSLPVDLTATSEMMASPTPSTTSLTRPVSTPREITFPVLKCNHHPVSIQPLNHHPSQSQHGYRTGDFGHELIFNTQLRSTGHISPDTRWSGFEWLEERIRPFAGQKSL